MRLIVRVGFDPEFAKACWSEGYSVTKTMRENLKEYMVEVINEQCITFIEFIAEEKNAATCEDYIRSVWRAFYPDSDNALKIHILEDDNSKIAEVMKVIYKNYYGWEEYMDICTDIARAVPLAKERGALSVLRRLNYLVAIDAGCGYSTMASSFADFLHKCEIFEEGEAKTDFYTYVVGKKDEDYTLTAADICEVLCDEDCYYTTVTIDISYFLAKENYEEFRKFMKRISDFSERNVFLFRVPYLEDKALKEIQDVISDMLEVKTIKIPPLHDFVLEEYMYDPFWKNGMSVDSSITEIYFDRIRKEKMDGRFYGFKTANKIANEMIFEKLKSDARKKYDGENYDYEKVYKDDLAGMAVEKSEYKKGFDELSELIGMEAIKERLEEIVAQIELAKNNEKMDRPCIHMRFVGAPGTGKTTVARIVGKILKEKGLLSKGDFFEYEARSLVGEYIGQTAPRTHSVCRDAYGSVLFIDEAYALYVGDSDKDYGKEAITTLIAEMENHRDDMVVIMAGYTDDMAKLMEANSGLRSRMPFMIEFKSYTRAQLTAIFMKMATKSFNCEEGLEEAVSAYFAKLADSYINSKEFANARFVRNLYERTWSKAAIRMAHSGKRDVTLTKADFEIASTEKEFAEKLMLDKKIGFNY